MQKNSSKQFDNPSKLFDFCQQCQCFHQAQYINGCLVMQPCQNSIQESNHDQKITSETNVTLSNTDSANSLSEMSIKTHLASSHKPNTAKSDRYRNLYLFPQPTPQSQQYSCSNASSQKTVFSQIPAKSPQRMYPLQSQPKTINFLQHQQQTIFPFHNNKTAEALVQNTNPIQRHPRIKPPQSTKQLQPVSIVFTNYGQQCFQTPQFGSQSCVSQNKQNSITSKRVIKEHKQFIIPNIIEESRQKTISQLQQESDYFCCGYIRKCNK